MSITRSVEFYAGRKNKKVKGFMTNTYYKTYEFIKDISYTEISFEEAEKELKEYIKNNNIKIGYCDVSTDFGAGYSLIKRYTYVNENGTYITRPRKYTF